MRNLLVVEDHPGATKALAIFLGRQSYDVRTAPDFATAFSLAEDNPPDLIIADISNFGGSSVIDARTLGWVVGVPVVVLTDLPSIDLGDSLTGTSTVDSVIFKPCSNAAVVRALRQIEEGLPIRRMSLSRP